MFVLLKRNRVRAQFSPFPFFESRLKTDSGYPKDAGVTMEGHHGKSWGFLCCNTYRSAPLVSALARSRGPRKESQSPVSSMLGAVSPSQLRIPGQAQVSSGSLWGSRVESQCQ